MQFAKRGLDVIDFMDGALFAEQSPGHESRCGSNALRELHFNG